MAPGMMRLLRIAAGFGLLAAGIAMLVLPGPGWVTIAAGLATLATDLPWAKRLLDRLLAAWRRARDAAHAAWTARRLGQPIVKAATDVLWARDRREMAAIDAILQSTDHPPSRAPTHGSGTRKATRTP